MKVNIETIPHRDQRYPTVGDYWEDGNGVLHIRVSEMGDEMYEGMVAVHELVEFLLTRQKGITEQSITDFDIEFESKREKGLVPDNAEPGFDRNAPYTQQHCAATSIEMIMCVSAGIKWSDYEHKINSL